MSLKENYEFVIESNPKIFKSSTRKINLFTLLRKNLMNAPQTSQLNVNEIRLK